MGGWGGRGETNSSNRVHIWSRGLRCFPGWNGLTVVRWQQFRMTTLDSWDLLLQRDLTTVAKGKPFPIPGYYKVECSFCL